MVVFFFKQKTAYEMRISDWSSDVCSSDLRAWAPGAAEGTFLAEMLRQVADRWLDPRNPMVMITSWNEWNEDTGIEPLAGAEATAAEIGRASCRERVCQ